MADTLKFDLVSPERLLMSKDVSEVVVPGAEGDFAVLPNHAPVLSTLRPGVIEVKEAGGNALRFYVRSGLADVTAESLTILAQRAVDLAGADKAWATGELKQAEADLEAATTDADRTHANHAIDCLRGLEASL